MRIGMILQNRFPPDIRVEKEARALIKAGHQVYLLCEADKDQRLWEGNIDGIWVRRCPIKPITNWARRVINKIKFRCTLCDPFWGRLIKRFIEDYTIHVLHVHDLPSVATAIHSGRYYGLPVVADLHENYPAAIKAWGVVKNRIKTAIDYKWWYIYERRVTRKADKILVVVEEAAARLVHSGIPKKKIVIVRNAVDLNTFCNYPLDSKVLRHYRGENIISYVGGFAPHRGLETLIEAIRYLDDSSIKLLLVGDNKEYGKRLENYANQYGVKDRVDIIGWQPFEAIPSYIYVSRVGIIPHIRSAHTNSTLPHKLFQYMAMGKPVIVSDCRPLVRIVQELGCGVIFRSGNAQDLAQKVKELLIDTARLRKCGESGRKGVSQNYNWEVESKKLVELYKGIR